MAVEGSGRGDSGGGHCLPEAYSKNMNTETIRKMDRDELTEWLEANTIAVEANGFAVDDRTDDDLRDEVCTVLASQYSDEDQPSRV